MEINQKTNISKKFNDILDKNFMQDKEIIRFWDSFDKMILNKRKKLNQKLRFSRIFVWSRKNIVAFYDKIVNQVWEIWIEKKTRTIVTCNVAQGVGDRLGSFT